jgi:polar amino acid transport system substrate-binding protein
MRRSTTTKAAALLAVVALAATACGGDDDTGGDTGSASATATEGAPGDATETGTASGDVTTVTEGTLTVCSEIPYPPFEFEDPDTGEFTGFDIDLMGAIADELGLELEVINTGFEGLQSGATLSAGQCDVGASAMTVTDAREENLDFSEPYFDAEQSLLVQADADIATLEDLAGMDIGVQSETTGAAYARENAPSDVTITEFGSGADAITALQASQVDGVVQDLGPNALAATNDDSLTVAETYATGESYGLAVAEEGSEALLEEINSALASLRESGTYDEIYATYFETE